VRRAATACPPGRRVDGVDVELRRSRPVAPTAVRPPRSSGPGAPASGPPRRVGVARGPFRSPTRAGPGGSSPGGYPVRRLSEQWRRADANPLRPLVAYRRRS
jgi:hypothetical protein